MAVTGFFRLIVVVVLLRSEALQAQVEEASEADASIALAAITISKAADARGAPVDLHAASHNHSDTTGDEARAVLANLRSMPLSAPAAISSRYGLRYHPTLGGARMHNGVDLAAPAGSPVLAPADGVVSIARWRNDYGLLISLEHGDGVHTRYAHLSRIAVSEGQRVSRGQIIGLVGSTGRSTGPHLHYEVHVNGRSVDPLAGR